DHVVEPLEVAGVHRDANHLVMKRFLRLARRRLLRRLARRRRVERPGEDALHLVSIQQRGRRAAVAHLALHLSPPCPAHAVALARLTGTEAARASKFLSTTTP